MHSPRYIIEEYNQTVSTLSLITIAFWSFSLKLLVKGAFENRSTVTDLRNWTGLNSQAEPTNTTNWLYHDDVIKWKHFPHYWPFVRGIQRPPVNSPQNKSQWRGALMLSLICVWINGCVNNREAGDLRRYHVHYHVMVMINSRTNGWRYIYNNIIWYSKMIHDLWHLMDTWNW